MFQDRDNGPAALPILMVRAARRAVAANPYDAQAQAVLHDANELLRRSQEDHWINYQARREAHPAMLRDRLRQTQLAASLYSAVQLAPDQYEANDRLADYYIQHNLLDLALEHKQIAERGLEGIRADPRYNAKQVDATLKRHHEIVKSLESDVKVRMAKWKEGIAKMHPLEQADYAIRGTFQDLINDKPTPMPLGLGKTGLEVLLSLKEDKLTADQQFASLLMSFELLLTMGQGEVVAQQLRKEAVRKALPASVYGRYQLLAAGATGDYEGMEQGAKQLEGIFVQSLVHLAPATLVWPTMQSAGPLGYTYAWQSRLALDLLATQNNELCNLMTLRGILALEAGDTQKARALFQSALDQSGKEHRFTERAIAQRYVDLLNAQKHKNDR
jgi:hypothetical protein